MPDGDGDGDRSEPTECHAEGCVLVLIYQQISFRSESYRTRMTIIIQKTVLDKQTRVANITHTHKKLS